MPAPRVLGILGGLGPMATVYFYEMLTRHTKVSCDQDHIINSRASTPDRTRFILGQSDENPFDIMAEDAARLVTFGADVLAIPCNTAHYFYDRLNESIHVPILNMVEQTVLEAKRRGCHKWGFWPPRAPSARTPTRARAKSTALRGPRRTRPGRPTSWT